MPCREILQLRASWMRLFGLAESLVVGMHSSFVDIFGKVGRTSFDQSHAISLL